ncbi:MAG: S-layer homology domain-containing protein, partial [Eubacteriales bacterium]
MKNVQKFLASSLALTLVVSATTIPTQASSFSDVPQDIWYASYVNHMADQGYVTGNTGTTYNPMGKLTIAAFSTMMANGFYGETLTTEKQQTSTEWWTPYLVSCSNRNGLLGTSAEQTADWNTAVTQNITRYEMATMIYNLLMERGVAPLSTEEISTIINDLPDKIDFQYQEAVATAVHYKFLNGKEGGTFDGSATSNRAEAAVVLSALVNSPLVTVERVTTTTTTPSTGTLISEAEAKRIALAHAGVSESEVTFAKVELDWDDGIQEYEVEFYVGYDEYDYEINALTGAILSYDRDMETPRPTTPSTGTLISEAEAKRIALAHAGVSES